MVLFDTDVLIWALRGNPRAARAIEAADSREVSIVSYMELIQGARDKDEVRLIRSFLADLGFTTAPLSENIGHRAAIYMEEYSLKGGLTLADSLLAATAVETQKVFWTGKAKHFRLISELDMKPFRPK